MKNEEYQVEKFDFPSTKEEQIQWVKELMNNQEATLFFKKRASHYNTTVIELQKMFFRQRGVCALCGDKLYFNEKTHVDHIIPKVLNGENNINNYQFVCAKCNYAKRDLPSKEFIIMCIKIAAKCRYEISKTEQMRVLSSVWKQQNTEEEIKKRKDRQNVYLEELNGSEGENFLNIIDDKVYKYSNELFKKYAY